MLTSDVQDWRQRFISHKGTQRCLMVAVVLGVGLIMGDGVLTPAISVVAAIEGLQTGIPSITRSTSASSPPHQPVPTPILMLKC